MSAAESPQPGVPIYWPFAPEWDAGPVWRATNWPNPVTVGPEKNTPLALDLVAANTYLDASLLRRRALRRAAEMRE